MKSEKSSYRIGCSGWGYADWIGSFYPPETPQKEFLKFYSSIFDTVEIDSSYYRIPSAYVVASWRKDTPENFLFTAKMPKKITHDNHLENVASALQYFYRSIGELKEKLGAVLVQLPPSFKYDKHKAALENFVLQIPSEMRHAVEFRHASWFKADILRTLESKNVATCWSINQYLTTPSAVTADFVYMRFVGDRSITEFGKVQKDQSEVMGKWAKEIDDKASSAREKFVLFNNHFAGFGPASVNEFRRLIGLMESDWSEKSVQPQKKLFDFS